jgi:hypothetical protein
LLLAFFLLCALPLPTHASTVIFLTTTSSGSLDDVRISNRTLSAAEVQQLYKLGTFTIHPN